MTQLPLLNLIFLGLGWPWVGAFVGFIKIFIFFPTQQNLVYRKHPTNDQVLYEFCGVLSSGARNSFSGVVSKLTCVNTLTPAAQYFVVFILYPICYTSK